MKLQETLSLVSFLLEESHKNFQILQETNELMKQVY